MLGEEIGIALGDDVDHRIADTYNVETVLGHGYRHFHRRCAS
jgi:hypothetical protein